MPSAATPSGRRLFEPIDGDHPILGPDPPRAQLPPLGTAGKSGGDHRAVAANPRCADVLALCVDRVALTGDPALAMA